MNSRFVCVINRNRDGYQVPLALAEAGILEAFVTDFYATPRWHRFLPAILRARWKPGVAGAKVARSWPAFLVQTLADRMRLPMLQIFPWVDARLARKCATLARRRGAGVYAYAAYLPDFHSRPGHMPVIDFEYHPHQGLVLDILSCDAERYPEVAQSYALEKTVPSRESAMSAWRRADAVVCASEMTRRSLEYDGCPADRITVIPYGFAPVATDAIASRPQGACEFLFVGQGIQRKGLHHLIRAWQAAPPMGARLTLVCYHIDPGIAALIRDPSIRLLGRQSRTDLDTLYDVSDVFVMPSLVEGFGLVYLEALERGCHIVGTANTGLPGLQLDSAAATLVPAGDIAALSATLAALTRRKHENGFDALAIAAQAGRWTWDHFRAAIARHAAGVLADWR